LTTVFGLLTPAIALAQFNAPPNFSLSPTSLDQGGCYTIRVSNWQGAVLNVGYTTAWTGQQYIQNWPSLNYNGEAVVCTSSSTHTGLYLYNSVSNTTYYQWWSINASITVNVPRQPTSLSFNPTSGYAGLDCYAMTIGNAGNMTVDLYYTFNSVYQPLWSAAMDGGAAWRYCINHHDQVGNYVFYQMKNHAATDWVSVSPPATFLVKAPQPLWLVTTPASIVQGNWYQMSVGNGAAVTLDLQFTLNDGPLQTITGWPTLVPGDGNYGYEGSSLGYVNIWTNSQTAPGKYVFTAMRNTLNSEWMPVSATLSVCPNAAPTISAIVPNIVPQGGSAAIKINGTNLCAATLQALTNNGLWFTEISSNPPFTSLSATANSTSSASVGPTQVRLTTPAGNVTAQFMVGPPAVLAKEYIYLGDRVISTVSP
jgi:hypothetical protein